MMKELFVSANMKDYPFDISFFCPDGDMNEYKLYDINRMHMIFVFNNEFCVSSNSLELNTSHGELTMVLPGNETFIRSLTGEGQFCVIHFLPKTLEMIHKIPHLETDLSYWYFNMTKIDLGVLKLNTKQIVKLESLLGEYRDAKSTGSCVTRIALMLELLTTVTIFLKQSAFFCNGKSTKNIMVDQAIAYINNNFKNEIRISDIADFLFINPKYLIHIFKQKTGITVKQYINQLRISFIKRLISTYPMSPKEAFLQSGFTDYSTFYRVFKNLTGHLPSEYPPPENKQQERK